MKVEQYAQELQTLVDASLDDLEIEIASPNGFTRSPFDEAYERIARTIASCINMYVGLRIVEDGLTEDD